MDVSDKGLIELMGHEGVCLSPYLDSVNVWTIGVGITGHDGLDVRSMGTITLEKAIALYKDRIKAYTAPIKKLPHKFTQAQFDALTSFCYNCGPGNLAKLVRNRGVDAIGDALMLYTIPKEITARRMKEQRLYKTGKYSNGGKVLVFPVSSNHRPIYSKGYQIDASKYFTGQPITTAPLPNKPAGPPRVPAGEPPSGLSLAGIWEWLKNN
jgi:lysozyme